MARSPRAILAGHDSTWVVAGTARPDAAAPRWSPLPGRGAAPPSSADRPVGTSSRVRRTELAAIGVAWRCAGRDNFEEDAHGCLPHRRDRSDAGGVREGS